MIKKDKKNLVKTEDILKKENKRNKKLGWFVLILLFIILIITQLVQYFNNSIAPNVDLPKTEHSEEIVAVAPKFEDEFVEVDLNVEDDFCDSLYEDLYEDEIAYNDCFDYISSTGFTEKLNQYRLFLANADKMISKFKNNENYIAELNIFSQIEHPDNIKHIIYLLKKYHDQLSVQQTAQEEIVDFSNNSFLSKLFKITIISPENNENKELKKQILEKIALFSNYIYASELQNKFLNN